MGERTPSPASLPAAPDLTVTPAQSAHQGTAMDARMPPPASLPAAPELTVTPAQSAHQGTAMDGRLDALATVAARALANACNPGPDRHPCTKRAPDEPIALSSAQNLHAPW
ncbi:hypothetical protein CYMTET_49816 [Cymbomonas tetramitiformis]|uniref:Uncharacterized protein n=1 Tax=Cymbomonas tetramitiformis TaxID=36881 RepID=A0AAE0EU62_9CHLO|nr:hypothetical protein CYMTET_49816 [Cymbomonas tetramitiformis]